MTEATQATATQTIAIASAFSTKYDFKYVTHKAYTDLYDKYAGENESQEQFYTRIAPQFDFTGLDKDNNITDATKFAKRKSVTVDLRLPADIMEALSLLEGKSRDWLLGVAQSNIANFVKDQYITPLSAMIGAYDIDTIMTAAASSGSRSTIDEEVLEEASKSLNNYFLTFLPEKAAQTFQTMAKGRFTKSSLMRGGLPVSEETVEKLKARLTAWLESVNAADAAIAEEYAPVYTLWVGNLDKLLSASNTASQDLASFL